MSFISVSLHYIMFYLLSLSFNMVPDHELTKLNYRKLDIFISYIDPILLEALVHIDINYVELIEL